MKIIGVLILASLSTGCMYELQRAWGCNNVGFFGCKDKAQPRTADDVPPTLRKAEGRPSVLTNSRGEHYYTGTPTYVPLIDDCLALGGTRGACIEALPPDELKKLEAEEARRGAMRRAQMRGRRAHEVFGGRREVPDER